MTRMILIAAALAFAATLPAMPAQAQANRTFVSAAGSDSNNCDSVTTPCRHFANAYAVTAANGEIDVLDPANYGALTITDPVSIEGHGWASIAAVSGQAAITINANTGDKINIIGVVLDGIAIAGTNGIAFNSGGGLTVRDSVIRNFASSGIAFEPSASSQLFVSNTLLSDNGIDGIVINNNGGTVTGVLDHVQVENNQQAGMFLDTGINTAFTKLTVSDCVIANNGADGISANSAFGQPISIMVRNTTIANNSANGLETLGNITGASISVTRSTITGNAAAWAATSGVVSSYADNNIDGNGGANSTPGIAITYH
jgi:hypothetical protein